MGMLDYHDYQEGEVGSKMHTDPSCLICGGPKSDPAHIEPVTEIHEFLPEPKISRMPECVICGEMEESGIHTPARGDIK